MGVAIPQVVSATEDRASGALIVDGGLRFDKTKSQYLTRTFGSGGNTSVWSCSTWVKRVSLAPQNAGNDITTYDVILTTANDTGAITFYKNYTVDGNPNSLAAGCSAFEVRSAAVCRDTNAWYHCLVTYDGTTCKLYINGVQITNFFPNTQNGGSSPFNSAIGHHIGKYGTLSSFASFYLSQYYFIDGQALTPSSFGYTDSLTNTWRPKKYTGTYGTNGFWLPMDGNTPIGKDMSGNNNDWTPVNFGGSNTIEKATGALPILNTDGGGKVARVGVRTDANASSLVLALPLVGVKDDVSNRVNSGSTTKTVTATNATGITTASNFYGGSFRFPGNASLTSPSNVDFALGTGDFTIEFWAYPTAYSTYDPYIITNVTNGFYIGKVDTVFALRAFNVGNLVTTTTFPPLNSWTHIAVTRQGTTARIFYNGVLITSGTTSQNFLQGELRIGDDGGGGGASYINSFIQDVRIYKGLAKYTSNFIPASTDPDIVPDSPSGVSYSSNLTQITDGAVAFDGSGDYLRSTGLEATGTSDYTIECFVYLDYISGTRQYIWDTRNSSGSSGTYLIKNESNTWYWTPDSTTSNDNNLSLDTIPTNRWTHIAFVRESGTAKLYVDGNLKATLTSHSGNLTSTQATIFAAWDNNVPGKGFISNFHIVKGTALYTSNFTPPSAPISSVANTKLLCCKSNSSATAADVTPGTITANGNAAATNFNPFTVNINTQRGKQSGYATWNPLKPPGGTTTFANGNLDTTFAFNGSTFPVPMGNVGVYTGRWYWEITPISGASGSGGMGVGIGNQDCAPTGAGAMGVTANAWGYYYSGNKYNNNSSSSYGSSYTNGDIIGVALDANIGSLSFYKNGIYQGVAYSGLSNTNTYFPAVGNSGDTTTVAANFGQKPFKFPPPAGFQPLTLANTPRPTIVRPDQYVGIVTYTGNGATQTVNVGLKPDFIWIKSRSNAYDHQLVDVVRGLGNPLYSNLTNSESTLDTVTATTLNGFTVNGSTYAGTNGNGATFVAWAWKAGGNSNTFNIDDVGYATASAAGLTAGTITPTGASVNTKSGFSIITYAGNGTSGATVSHGLGRTPSLLIVKRRSSAGTTPNWAVWHSSLSAGNNLFLNTTDDAQAFSPSRFTSTIPTSSVFSLGGGDETNYNTGTFVAYSWAEIPGFSKFGRYTGNGLADGPAIITGFRPRWLLIKQSSASGENWRLFDTERDKYNPTQNRLLPNSSGAEAVGVSNELDTLSNGFKLRSTDGASNGSGATYIYAAFAEAPSINLYGAQANAR